MKEAGKGFLRAVAILIGLLIVFNLLKPIIYGNQSQSPEDAYGIHGDDTDTPAVKLSYDKKYDYESIYNKYDFKYVQEIFGSEFSEYYYKDKEFSDDFYLYVAVMNLTKNKFTLVCHNSIDISESTIKDKVTELFGKVTFNHKSYTSADGNMVITYNGNSKTYNVVNNRCSGIDIKKGYIETKFLGGIDNNGVIEIYENAHLVKQTEDNNGVLSVNNYYGVNESTGIAKTSNNYYIYKYTFTKEGDSFYLNKIEKYEK